METEQLHSNLIFNIYLVVDEEGIPIEEWQGVYRDIEITEEWLKKNNFFVVPAAPVTEH